MAFMTNNSDVGQNGKSQMSDFSAAFDVTTEKNGTETSGFYIGEKVFANFELNPGKLGYLSPASVPFGFFVEHCQVKFKSRGQILRSILFS